jgi:hypothetical protein
MLAPAWIKFNPAHVYSSLLKGQDVENREEIDKTMSTSNVYKISNQLNKSSNLIKDP